MLSKREVSLPRVINIDASSELSELISKSFRLRDVLRLLDSGANPNTKCRKGIPLLHHLLQHLRKEGMREQIVEIVNDYKANINVKDGKGRTPLQYLFCLEFTGEDALSLIKLGADPNSKNLKGDSLLHIFALNLHLEGMSEQFTQLVKEHKADIDIKNANGETVLEHLVNNTFSMKDAMLLVRLGANPNILDKNGKSLYEIFAGRNAKQSILDDLAIYQLGYKNYNDMENMLAKIQAREFKEDDLERLGKYPQGKEKFLEHFKTLGIETELKVLRSIYDDAKDNNCDVKKAQNLLTKIFLAKRGKYAPRINHGIFVEINKRIAECEKLRLKNPSRNPSAMFGLSERPKKDVDVSLAQLDKLSKTPRPGFREDDDL